MKIRQRAVALYFIDKVGYLFNLFSGMYFNIVFVSQLALRAGNEKDEDQADTVGCCSLRVEHIKLHEQKNGKQFVVVFDFLGNF